MGGGEMTPEKQRIAIAQACGWTNVKHEGITVGIWSDNGWIPQYLKDLNAMHKAEKVLWDTGKAMEFTNQLVGIVCSARGFRWDKGTSDDHLMCLSHATAAERAEAFLRTIGKWEEAL
jgi:hypothetical protein